MANEVAVSMKIFLEDQGKMGETIAEISKIVKVNSHKTEDIGFGIKALKIIFLMPDGGGIDELEEKIATVPNVSQAQIEEVSRL
ncbi:Elongation factor 1-beta [uncultured archaeon]|nr:Elongation factor 1-beta [uncultured archaeon]